MNDKPTFPPKPVRPPPKPVRIPPVVEKAGSRSYPVNPYRGLSQDNLINPPRRHHTPSEVDIEVVRHQEQLKGLERRVDGLEDVTGSIDGKLDKISEVLATEINDRKLEKAGKEEKTKEDQKTKRLQAILIAIPLILSPFLGFFGSYMAKEPPNYKTNTVVVSEYTQEAEKCKATEKDEQSFTECVRAAQLKNTPVFRK